eukprot:5098785-Amphidinium_carterae.1
MVVTCVSDSLSAHYQFLSLTVTNLVDSLLLYPPPPAPVRLVSLTSSSMGGSQRSVSAGIERSNWLPEPCSTIQSHSAFGKNFDLENDKLLHHRESRSERELPAKMHTPAQQRGRTQLEELDKNEKGHAERSSEKSKKHAAETDSEEHKTSTTC